MTTPKEALDSLLAYRHGDTKHLTPEHARILYETLASIEGDAVERVASGTVSVDLLQNERNVSDMLRSQADGYRARIAELEAKVDIQAAATGLVPDEAASPRTILSSDCVDPDIEQAIRADEREKCARVAESVYADPNYHMFFRQAGTVITAAIRSNRREA